MDLNEGNPQINYFFILTYSQFFDKKLGHSVEVVAGTRAPPSHIVVCKSL